ncbi:MAG: cation-translocating P-type ATPase, partial [Oscillospiraceae bacterium]|nr:cation-translocating P-type ATPase [Oscillospiraceae bacterium]
HGEALVTATGMSARMGKIAALLEEEKEPPTPLQRKLASLGRFIAISSLFCALAVIALGLLRGETLYGLVLTAVSLAVAAVPEGLPAVVTIVLALSVGRLLAKNAVIRKLHAVETLGSATVICTDKTGTLTENLMTAREFCAAGKTYILEGASDDLNGALSCRGVSVNAKGESVLKAALECAALCCTASAEARGGKLVLNGSPTESALLAAAYKCGVKRPALLKEYEPLDERPFDSVRKYMSVFVSRGSQRAVMAKGAPGALLKRCTHIADEEGLKPLTPRLRAEILSQADSMAKRAMRVIAMAASPAESFKDEGLVFLGLAGLLDPPRKEAAAAVRSCRRARIKVIMITGDHPLTARAIALETGIIKEEEEVISGEQLDAMGERELTEAVKDCRVFARVSPEHKLRIVKALRASGQTVAMTGDGVNDAPAVRAADIGVAMGLSGSDVTKEAASLVVLDDNFATIVAAVGEGRAIYDNIRRFIRFLLASNLGEVLTVLLAMAIGAPAVFIPLQILLINLITDSLPAIALGMQSADEDVMSRPPRPPKEGLFAGGLALEIVFRGVIMGLANLLCFTAVLRVSGDLTTARSAALLTLVAAQMTHVFECALKKGAKPSLKTLFGSRSLNFACLLSLGVTSAVIWLPFFQGVFSTAALSGLPLLIALGSALISPLAGALLGARDASLQESGAKQKGADAS